MIRLQRLRNVIAHDVRVFHPGPYIGVVQCLSNQLKAACLSQEFRCEVVAEIMEAKILDGTHRGGFLSADGSRLL